VSIQLRPGQVITQCALGLHEGGEGPIEEADGATVSFRFVDMADATSGSVVPGVYDSAGQYCADLTAPTEFGRYRLEVATTLSGRTTYAHRDVTVGVAYKGGTTVADLRRSIAMKLRDWVGITATQTSAGMSTFTDEDNLWQEAYALASSQVVLIDAHPDNVGAVRRVTGNDGAGTITLARDLPQPIALGDTADLVNIAGRGFTVSRYTEAVKEALRDAARDVRIPIEVDIPTAFDMDDPYVTLPYGMTEVYAIEYNDGYDSWGIGPARTRSAASAGWFAEGGGRVRVEGFGRLASDGYTIRAYGYGPHPDVYADDDIVAIDPEWVVATAASRLASLRTESREWSQWAALWTQEANGRRLAMAPAYEPDSRSVR
jgi:hypothetical protein